jgi:hypothetical protein
MHLLCYYVSTFCVLKRGSCSEYMMTSQNLCSAAKLNFPVEFGLDSNEARGAWSNYPSCVHFSLIVNAREGSAGNH